jgi:hypothetical protein
MKVFDILSEDNFGTNPKRPSRPNSRPARGHEAQPRYKTNEIAGAFPSPSTREKWAKDAAASNAAEAKRQAELKAKADAERLQKNTELVDKEQKINYHSLDSEIPVKESRLAKDIAEAKATRALCTGSIPDEDLGASQLASCKSQGLRARDGNKSHKLGKSPKSRVKVGGKRIKGNKYGGPLPDWS